MYMYMYVYVYMYMYMYTYMYMYMYAFFHSFWGLSSQRASSKWIQATVTI